MGPVPISKRRDGREGETRYELLSLRANLPRALAPSPIVEMKNCHGGLNQVLTNIRICGFAIKKRPLDLTRSDKHTLPTLFLASLSTVLQNIEQDL